MAAFLVPTHTRELLWVWTTRQVKVRYKQSLFGAAWAVFQPLALTAVFAFVFSYIVRVQSEGIPYPIFVYSTMLPWTFFSRALAAALSSIVANMSLVTKVYFPREVLPIATVATHFVDYLCGLAVLLGMLVYYRVSPSPTMILVPVILAIQLILMIGLALGGAAANTFFRDVNQMVPLLLQIWMYACPIVYPLSMVPLRLRRWYLLNPMAGIIDAYRQVIVKGALPDWYALGVATAVSIAVAIAGYVTFKRLEDQFADVI
ncbi:MAG: putative O-antigen export system, permease protein RfbA [Deltaproteobacteria bacterium]|jgi:lipopolysaccharide transport system permease protein|nr:putative O-antigen export system, permease protein RfbA [Deltaproteobacteria bacterium]